MSYFSCQEQKSTISRGFNLISYSRLNPRWRPRWLPLLVTSQASSSVTTHKNTPHLVENIKGFSLIDMKARSFRNTATYQRKRKKHFLISANKLTDLRNTSVIIHFQLPISLSQVIYVVNSNL